MLLASRITKTFLSEGIAILSLSNYDIQILFILRIVMMQSVVIIENRMTEKWIETFMTLIVIKSINIIIIEMIKII